MPKPLLKLQAQHLRAIAEILTGKNCFEVAAVLNVHETTVRTWRADPMFKAALKQAIEDSESEAREILRAAKAEAARHIVRCTQAADPTATSVSAAKFILEFGENRNDPLRVQISASRELEAWLEGADEEAAR